MAEEREEQDGDQQDSDQQENGDEQRSTQDPDDQERLIPDDEISEDGQVYVDRDTIDFDPEEGLYSGTAVHGGTDIPGPHEQVDDIDPEQAAESGTGGDGDEATADNA